MSPGTVSFGAVVSCTMTWNLAEAALPRASVAEQLTSVTPILNVPPDGGEHVTGTLPSTRSVAVAEYVTGGPLGPVASAVWSCTPRTGAVVSTTVTVKSSVAVLPDLSDAEQVTVVLPSGKVPPERAS